MKTIALILFLATACHAGTFYLTFSEPTNAAAVGVQHYDAWWQATNDGNPQDWHWIGSCPAGQTNIALSGVGTVLPNPCYLSATATGGFSNVTQSAWAPPLTFDTNDWPNLEPQPTLMPPTGLGIKFSP